MEDVLDPEQEVKLLGLATELSNALEDRSGTLAIKVVMLVQYVAPDGKVYDAFFHAGEPRFSEIFGMLESHRLRVKAWFESGLHGPDVTS